MFYPVGTPVPTITWERADGEDFTENTEVFKDSGVLQLNAVTGPEQGIYICSATNEAGSVSISVTLRIAGRSFLTKFDIYGYCIVMR